MKITLSSGANQIYGGRTQVTELLVIHGIETDSCAPQVAYKFGHPINTNTVNNMHGLPFRKLFLVFSLSVPNSLLP